MDIIPRYGGGSLADLLPSALTALGLPGPDPLGLRTGPLAEIRRLAVLLVDGLGYHLLPTAARVGPALAELITGHRGYAGTLTCGFPSTTPVSLASVGTGAPPGTHGLLGFSVNVPGTDTLLNHIRWADDPDPLQWQPVPTQFERAAAAGVTVVVVNKPEFIGTGLTRAVYRGATYRPASTTDEVAAQMLDALTTASTPALVYGYTPSVDSTAHRYGVESAECVAAMREVDALVDRLVNGLPPDAALLVTADHGIIDVPPEARLDTDTIPELWDGVRLVAGEPRVRYLHTHPGAREDVITTWRSVLGSWTAASNPTAPASDGEPAVSVMSREEAVATGWFGTVPEEHLARLGDVVVVCRERYILLTERAEPPQVARFVAYHGSITEAEMLIPLLIARADNEN